ncbi:Lysophospholipase L1 [Singulisphaera sp. GP187]|uniref:rhamnogalacturonan acetylesterase n=1 Tax=Singulisphaera sp. GP187 TaxID=1882752 RepID=UPI0009298509|nr:rhamnogalacturonan acetylesterase [Singulisphaera sp. GP187]SIO60473.1 Lysophospholipase L1 [Singulisphaera sp. GP187]
MTPSGPAFRFIRTARGAGGILLLLAAQTSISTLMAQDLEARDATKPAQAKSLRIVLIGDSTVADGSGWGPSFAKRVGPGVECINMARSGRSSRSYRDEGHWRKALDLKPDYVLIQFGHNDQPGKGPKRETDPETTYRQFLTRYIDETKSVGAQPILVTSMTRRRFSRAGKIESDLSPYVDAVKRLGRAKSVPVIDLHARSIERLNTMGPKAAEVLNPKDVKTGGADRTHLTPKGGEPMADLVIQELKKVEPALADRLD